MNLFKHKTIPKTVIIISIIIVILTTPNDITINIANYLSVSFFEGEAVDFFGLLTLFIIIPFIEFIIIALVLTWLFKKFRKRGKNEKLFY